MTTTEATANETPAVTSESGSEIEKIAAKLRHGWRVHPAVRSADQLTLGERAADRMRNSMGSWAFVFCALLFLAGWMLYNGVRGGHSYDPYPFILLNLVLSCLAAMQGAILLIAAKRSDQVASELAQHDYETDCRAEKQVEALGSAIAELHNEHRRLHEQISEITAKLVDAQRS
jgi:uncharacterized membrane protein